MRDAGRCRMNEQNHARAEQLIAHERVEGISQAERDWLSTHLQECPNCAAHAQETDQALRTLRIAAIPLPVGLASAPYVWRLFEWFGERTGVPKLVWELGFGLWWTIPALFVLIVLLMEKVRPGGEPDWIRQSK